ncbi:MAG: outer membrane lipoprotein carrier protein LolA [Alphaproteobacteria bacterium]|nr:outer membrane lipoprotein carrier protein LolA [Alphaproteobacteria bacterium]
MKRVLIVLAGALALALPASAACVAPEQLAALTGSHDFVQTRTLKGVSRPLVSSGQVTPQSDGVLWTVTHPIEIVTHVTPTGITQSIEGGPEQPVGPSGSNNPFISETGLIELLKGDLSKLDQRYDVTRGVRARPEGWTLQLKPKGAALAPYISGIAVEGCKRVESITVEQANGDTIRIDLKDGAA